MTTATEKLHLKDEEMNKIQIVQVSEKKLSKSTENRVQYILNKSLV